MPEAFAVFLIIVLSGAVYLFARHTANASTEHDPEKKRAELISAVRGYEEKLERARRESWGPELLYPLEERLAAAEKALHEDRLKSSRKSSG